METPARHPRLILYALLLGLAGVSAVTAQDHPPKLREGEYYAIPGREQRAIPQELDYKVEALDPTRDGWESEVLSSSISARLKKMTKLMTGQVAARDLEPYLAPGFVMSSFVPPDLVTVYDRGGLTVRRTPAARSAGAVVGAGGFAEEIASWQGKADTGEVRIEAKILGIELDGRLAVTPVHVMMIRVVSGRLTQENAIWRLTWSRGERGSDPQLRSLEVESFEEVRGPSSEPLFADATVSVLGAQGALAEQLTQGSRWDRDLDVAVGTQLLGHFGLAVGDVNGDGRDDLYLAQPGGLPNRLLLQNSDGTVADGSAEAGVDYLDATTSSLLADLDNDGDQDLIVALGVVVVHENLGQGKFSVRAILPVSDVFSMALADFDQDGHLDLYLCRYGSPADAIPVPYHDANNGRQNILFRNAGGWRFNDVTKAVGLDENNMRFSFAAGWVDYDGDGDVDLYVANDFGRNNLYRNEGGHFADVAGEAGVEDQAAGMSVTWGDYNNDGLLDLYVSNMFSAAGRRTTFQRNFKATASEKERLALQRLARGNSLFENVGDGTFRDVSEDASVTLGRWAWGSKFADLNNDGWEDLFVVNGYVTNEDDDDL